MYCRAIKNDSPAAGATRIIIAPGSIQHPTEKFEGRQVILMQVYGADFSGARNPSRGIYYAEGKLNKRTLHLERVVHCDDRLDLLMAIHFSKAPWGLDFPFSIPAEAFSQLKLGNWSELLTLAAESERAEFDDYLENSGIPGCEVRCRDCSTCCRAADAAVQAFSPFKKTKPTMRMMTYAGLKLLSYLHQLGHRVYPFDQIDLKASRLYEVYPSHCWRQVGLKGNKNLALFADRFHERYGLKVTAEDSLFALESPDAVDAAVACICLGYVLASCELEADWGRRQAWMSEAEWVNRHLEGLIVKVSSNYK